MLWTNVNTFLLITNFLKQISALSTYDEHKKISEIATETLCDLWTCYMLIQNHSPHKLHIIHTIHLDDNIDI